MILSYLRTAGLYLLLIALVRFMGKRQVGQMGPAEFVVTMLIANLASIPMEDNDVPLVAGLVPLLTVAGTELTLNLATMKSPGFRQLVRGKPVILIENGKLLQSSLKKTRLTLEELMEQLRLKDVLRLQDVQFAILETGGGLSVFPYPDRLPATARDAGVQAGKQALPLTLICDGRVLEENLLLAEKDRQWLEAVLAQRCAQVESTLLLTLEPGDRLLWLPREVKP